MPGIEIIFQENGKNTLIKAEKNMKFSEVVNKFCKTNCISKKVRPNLRFAFKGSLISSFDENLDKLCIGNSSVISVSNEEFSNMEKAKDNWKDGIIAGKGLFSFLSEKNKNFIFDNLKQKVSKRIKNKLYSATEDGDTANIFHKKCDNKGPLLYLIKTTNDLIFGIYISKPLSSDGMTKTDSTQMVICPYKNFANLSLNNNATYHCFGDKGALFHCMQINTPFLSSNCIDIQSCSDFTLPCYPSGNSSYKIKKLEVYSLEESI